MQKLASSYLQLCKVIWLLLFIGLHGLYSYFSYQIVDFLFPNGLVIQSIVIVAQIISLVLFLFIIYNVMRFGLKSQLGQIRTLKLSFIQFILHSFMLILFYVFAEIDDAPGLILIGCIIPFIVSNLMAYIYLQVKNVRL